MGPVAVTTVVPVELATDSEPETDAEVEMETEPDWASLVVLTGMVEPPAIVRAFWVSRVTAEEAVVQGAPPYQSLVSGVVAWIELTNGDANTSADGRESAHGSVVVVTAVTNQGLLDGAAIDADALDIGRRVCWLAVWAL